MTPKRILYFFLLIILATLVIFTGCTKPPTVEKDEEVESMPWLDGTYSGYLSFAMPHGQGVWTGQNGAVYEGKWKYGLKDGYGVWTGPNGDTYRGYWANNKKHGIGNFTGVDGEKYDGEWKNDQRNGFGVWTSPGGDRYEGYWKDDLKDGTGTYTGTDGETYEGDWQYGLYNGTGRWTNDDGEVYAGEFLNGFFHGEGIWLNADGDSYEGSFAYGEKHGEGTYTRADGTVEEGAWVAGVKTVVETAVKEPYQRYDSFTPGEEIFTSDQLHVRRLRFFESGEEPIGPGSRVYAKSFDSSKPGYIYWELELYSPDVELDREFSISFTINTLNIEETGIYKMPAGQEKLIITGPNYTRIPMPGIGTYVMNFRIRNFYPTYWIPQPPDFNYIDFSGMFHIN